MYCIVLYCELDQLLFFGGEIPRDETLRPSLTSLTVVEELNQISSLFLPNVDAKTSKTAKARSKRSDKGPVLKNALLSLLY